MSELVEYSLVVMVSALFVSGSVLVYDEFASFGSGLSLRAAFDEVSAVASQSLENGSATATLTLPPAEVSCSGGVLSVTIAGSSLNGSIPTGCAFAVNVPGGTSTFSFNCVSSRLELTVS